MNRGKKAVYNMIASICAECISLICGFVLPRLILSGFGSSYNGLTQSVTQFLSVVALMRAGVGGATRAALYRSLANNDEKQISATIKATELFMRKVAILFAVFVVGFSCLYPLIISNEFDWLFSSSLILIIAASTFIQYYFGITYEMLLQADQRQYVSTIILSGTTLLNTIVSVILIRSGCGIHGVKLGSTFVYCLAPLMIYLYANRHYHIDHTVTPDFSSINQRWDAMFHQIAGFIYSNTDIMLLTIFTNLKEVSVYATYCLVSNGLKQLMSTVTTGVEAAFGDMLARGDKQVLVNDIRLYETLLHGTASVIYGAAIVLITPFIMVYTNGIDDAGYARYLFGFLLITTDLIHLLRQPYHSIVEAAGHFKQTKHIAIIQACMNLGVSLLMVARYGLVGVLIGTFLSDFYRGIAYRVYVSRNILTELTAWFFLKRCLTTILSVLTVCVIARFLPYPGFFGYLEWAGYAVIITLISIGSTFLLTTIFYRKEMGQLHRKILGILRSIVRRT